MNQQRVDRFKIDGEVQATCYGLHRTLSILDALCLVIGILSYDVMLRKLTEPYFVFAIS